MQKDINELQHQLNRKINNFNHILEREIADREIKEIGELEDKLKNLQEQQKKELIR